MPSTDIVFSPSVDERQLDRETEQVDDRLQQVGQDVPVTFDTDDVDGITPAGGGGGGSGLGGASAAGGVAGLASKIPKPVAGVTAAAALPVALTGGVGAGMLSAMQNASARLQTDTQLLGVAVDNFFREPGNVISESITRPLAKNILGLSTKFDEIARGEGLAAGLQFLLTGRTPDMEGIRPGAAIGGGIGALFGGPVGMAVGSRIGSWLGSQLDDALSDLNVNIPEGMFNLPNINIPEGLFGLPTINVRESLFNLPTIDVPAFKFGVPNIQVPSYKFELPEIDVPEFKFNLPEIDIPTPDIGGGGGGGFDPDINPFRPGNQDIPGLQSGGRVERGGVARVHRGELVSDPDRLVSELANAVSDAGGGGATVDMGRVESKLDDVNRNLKRLMDAMNQEIVVDGETLGRVAQENQRDRITDTDPLAD